MISPEEVAAFVADVIQNEEEDGKIFELTGPAAYSSEDVAKAFSEALGKEVTAQQIPREQWENTLQEIGFSADGIRNFVEMTEAVINGKAKAEKNGTTQVKVKTTLKDYILQHVPAAPPAATKARPKASLRARFNNSH
jgi:uncharacterized protein YbjT (DUF2867 family)